MKHTKGPWKIGKSNIMTVKEEYGDIRKGYIDIDSDRWGGLAICYRHEINESDAECEANAKLIAAAPDLLEALLKVRKYANENGLEKKLFDLFYIADTAIDKATK